MLGEQASYFGLGVKLEGLKPEAKRADSRGGNLGHAEVGLSVFSPHHLRGHGKRCKQPYSGVRALKIFLV